LDWSFARPVAPAITITSIILSSNQMQNEEIPIPAYYGCREKWLLDNCHVIIPGFSTITGFPRSFQGLYESTNLIT